MTLTRNSILNGNNGENGSHTENVHKLVLNEVFAAEKDVASASRYRLVPDGKDLGMFKSSGLIVSTGSGSSGWL